MQYSIKHAKYGNVQTCMNWIVRPQGDTNKSQEKILKTSHDKTAKMITNDLYVCVKSAVFVGSCV